MIYQFPTKQLAETTKRLLEEETGKKFAIEWDDTEGVWNCFEKQPVVEPVADWDGDTWEV